MNVNVFVQVDNIAMEQDEIISLTLTKTAGGPFLEVFVINVIIIDSDGKCYLKCFLHLLIIFKYLTYSIIAFNSDLYIVIINSMNYHFRL